MTTKKNAPGHQCDRARNYSHSKPTGSTRYSRKQRLFAFKERALRYKLMRH